MTQYLVGVGTDLVTGSLNVIAPQPRTKGLRQKPRLLRTETPQPYRRRGPCAGGERRPYRPRPPVV